MDDQQLLEGLAALVAVATLPAAILTTLFVEFTFALAVLGIGWFVLLPVIGIAARMLDETPDEKDGSVEAELEQTVQDEIRTAVQASHESASAGPVEELRQRYARGEIDDYEFERKLEAVLEMDELDPDDRKHVARILDVLDTDARTEPSAGKPRGQRGTPETTDTRESETELGYE